MNMYDFFSYNQGIKTEYIESKPPVLESTILGTDKSKPAHPTFAFAFALLHLQCECKRRCRVVSLHVLAFGIMDDKLSKFGWPAYIWA